MIHHTIGLAVADTGGGGGIGVITPPLVAENVVCSFK